MASLLDFVLSNQQGPMRLLDSHNRMASLFDGAEPAPAPDIFHPGAPASIPQLSAAAGMQGQPQSPVPDVQMVASMQDAARQQAAQQLAQLISAKAGGQLPERAIPFIDEASREAHSGPGQPGRNLLARLFAGERVPGLTAEQNRAIRKESMIMAGLTILAQPHGTSVGQALALGVLAGRMHATTTAGQLIDEQAAAAWTQETYSILTNTEMSEISRWQEVQRRAVSEGRMDAAKMAQDVIKDLRDLAAGEAEARFQNINGQTFAVDPDGTVRDPFSREIISEAPPSGSKLVNVMTPAGQMTFREGPDGALYDPFTGRQVQAAPQPAPAVPDLDTTRLGQIEQEIRSFRSQERGLANVLADVSQIKAKLEETGRVSSVDQRALAARLSQALEAGNLRESSIQAISGSGGLAGFIESAIGQLSDGAASPTVARDLIQAIERSGNQARRELERERGDIRRRVESVRGITTGEVEAAMGRSPFAPQRPEVQPDEDDDDDFGFGSLPQRRQ